MARKLRVEYAGALWGGTTGGDASGGGGDSADGVKAAWMGGGRLGRTVKRGCQQSGIGGAIA